MFFSSFGDFQMGIKGKGNGSSSGDSTLREDVFDEKHKNMAERPLEAGASDVCGVPSKDEQRSSLGQTDGRNSSSMLR